MTLGVLLGSLKLYISQRGEQETPTWGKSELGPTRCKVAIWQTVGSTGLGFRRGDEAVRLWNRQECHRRHLGEDRISCLIKV